METIEIIEALEAAGLRVAEVRLVTGETCPVCDPAIARPDAA